MKLQYAQYAQLVQYALYKSNEHYNELVVHMKQTSASCYTYYTTAFWQSYKIIFFVFVRKCQGLTVDATRLPTSKLSFLTISINLGRRNSWQTHTHKKNLLAM